jgi:hypothetical protein
MQTNGFPSSSVLDQYIQVFADTIAQEFGLPAAEALRRINAELAGNPVTQHVRLRLRDMLQELQARETDAVPAHVQPAHAPLFRDR